MSVYFIRIGEEGPVKIGYSSNVAGRLQKLQVCHPEGLCLIRAVDGGIETETWFHSEFSNDRIRGEWFKFCPRMLEIEPPDLAPILPPTAISELIDAFGGATEFARVIDKIPSTASEMKRSGSIRIAYWPRIIAAATERGIVGISFETLALMHLDNEEV